MPQMVALYKDPQGDKVFNKVNRSSHHSNGSNSIIMDPDREAVNELTTLRNRVIQLEKQLKLYEEGVQLPNNL